MRSISVFTATALVCLLSVLPSELPAANGAIPIWEPTTITESGRYVVTRDIVGIPPDPVLTIAASNVHVDLNGFTLRNDGADYAILAAGVSSIVVENGAIVHGGNLAGIEFDNVRDFVLRRMVTTASAANGYGISLSLCENGTVENNVVGGNVESSLGIDRGGHITVRHNVLSNTDCEAGVLLGGDYLTFVDNQLESCSRIAVYGSGNRISNNDVHSTAVDSAIIVSGSRNRIEGNTLLDNAGFGLRFWPDSSDNFFRGNVARGNNGTGCTGAASGGDFCDEGTNNTSHGDNYMPDKM